MIILRYLSKEIYKTMFFTVAILLLILVTNQLVNLLNRAAMGRMAAMTVVQAVMLGIPQYLTYMIPLAIFLAIIVVIGKLSANHELISMHASGFSKGQLLRHIMLIALPVFAFVALLTFELAPLSSNLERAVLRQAVMSSTLDKVIPGQFQSFSGPESVFHANSKTGNQLNDVLLVQPIKKNQSNKLPAPIWDITRAQSANQQIIHNTDYLVFHQGRRVVMQPGALWAEEFWFDEYGLYTPIPNLASNTGAVGLSTADLWRLRHNLSDLAEWQWRFAIPISVFMFALIAFPLSRIQPRQGKFMRVFPAVLIYALYVSLLFCSRSWIKAGMVPSWIGMWWVPMLAALLVTMFFIYLYIKMRCIRRRHD